MRLCLPVALALALLATHAAPARAQGSDRFGDGLTPGAYVRVSGASVSPVNPEGSLRDWNRGQGVNVMYENWVAGSSGSATHLGFGLYVDYSMLPFNEQQFLADFTNSPIGRATSATAKRAQIIQIGVNTRLRIPMPFIMPSIGVGFGFLDWRPGKIDYTTASGRATAKQQYRSGGELSLLAGLDKHIYDRWAIFAEAVYTYAYTSFGRGLAASGSSCVASDCDLLKNTQLGTVRGGIRVKVGQ